MGFTNFLRKQWKQHQINKERQRIEREELRRIGKEAKVAGYSQEMGRQRARAEIARRKRQYDASSPESMMKFILGEPKKKKRRR
jgi:hypothetical protein